MARKLSHQTLGNTYKKDAFSPFFFWQNLNNYQYYTVGLLALAALRTVLFSDKIYFQNPKTDSVHIDVWNFESVGTDGSVVDRLKRLGEVKDSRGLKRLITDTVAPPAADRLIGKVPSWRNFAPLKKSPHQNKGISKAREGGPPPL